MVSKGENNIKYLNENGVKFGMSGLTKMVILASLWCSVENWEKMGSHDQIKTLIQSLKNNLIHVDILLVLGMFLKLIIWHYLLVILFSILC